VTPTPVIATVALLVSVGSIKTCKATFTSSQEPSLRPAPTQERSGTQKDGTLSRLRRSK
jgi:hypothetical protein